MITEELDNDISIGIKCKLPLFDAKLNDVSAGNIYTSFLNKTTMLSEQRHMQKIYRVSQEERTKLREGVPYVKLYQYNPKHLCPKLNGY